MKICILSQQSVFCRASHSGVGEFVDGLAISLAEQSQDVYVIVQAQSKRFVIDFSEDFIHKYNNYITCQFLKVHYYLIKNTNIIQELLKQINPDIIQCIDWNIDLDNWLLNKTIYTIDENFPQYNYKKTLALSPLLKEQYHTDYALSMGILSDFISPKDGLFLPCAYTANNMYGKITCKNSLLKDFKIQNYTIPLFLYMGRLNKKKGIEDFPLLAEEITNKGGKFICIGPGDDFLDNPNILRLNKWVEEWDTIKYLAGADFYLAPSIMESSPLMPRHACRYGTIPLVRLAGGAGDVFNENNCIIIKNIHEAIDNAFLLWHDKKKLFHTRKQIMEYDFSWKKYIPEWIKMYEDFLIK